MKVINLIENEDGSANMELDLTNEELAIVVELGFTQLLINSIKADTLCNNQLTTKQE